MGEASEMSGMSEVSTAETGKGGAGGGGSKAKILVPVVLLLLLLAIVGVVLITGSSDDTAQQSSEGAQGGDGTSSGTSSGGGTESDGPPKPPTKAPFSGPNKVLFCFIAAEKNQLGDDLKFPDDGVCTHLILGGHSLQPFGQEFQHGDQYDIFRNKFKSGQYKTTEGGLSVDVRYMDDTRMSPQKLKIEYESNIMHYGGHYLKDEKAWTDYKTKALNYMKSIHEFHEQVSPDRMSNEAADPLYGFVSMQPSPFDPSKPKQLFELAQEVEDAVGFPLLFLMHTNIEKPLNVTNCLMGGTPMAVLDRCKRPSLTNYMGLMNTFTFKKNSKTAATFNMALMKFSASTDITQVTQLSSLNLTADQQAITLPRSELCNVDTYPMQVPVDDTMKVEAKAKGVEVVVYDSEDTLKLKLNRLAAQRPGTHLGYAVFYAEFDTDCDGNLDYPLLKKFQALCGIRRK